jgi:uncharacterized protein
MPQPLDAAPDSHRRRLLTAGSLLAAAPVVGASLVGGLGWTREGRMLSAASGRNGHHLVCMATGGEVLWRLSLPVRAHAVAMSPVDGDLAVVVARRPGRLVWVVDVRQGRLVRSMSTRPDRYLSGHAVFSPEGRHLITSEFDPHDGRGYLGVRDVATGQWLGERDSHGLGPHEMHFDVDGRTLWVANGGIHADTVRPSVTLNMDTMAPSLVRLDWFEQRVLGVDMPAHHQLSLRHLDVTPVGDVVVGLQFEGADRERASMPVLALRRQGRPGLQVPWAEPDVWQKLGGYIGSVRASADGRWALATSPRGNSWVAWDLSRNRLSQPMHMNDVCGVCFDRRDGQALITAGSTAIRRLMLDAGRWRDQALPDGTWQWDNHAEWI